MNARADSLADAHAHVIAADFGRYSIPSEVRTQLTTLLAEPYTVERLLGDMDREGVLSALLVQRSQLYGFDNGYVCDASAAHPVRLRAVCAIDARQSDCSTVARGWAQRGAAGFRLMQQTRDDDLNWLAGPLSEGLWRLCADSGLPLCVHFFPWNRERGITQLLRMIGEYPHTLVVVDHLSNCPINKDGHLQTDDLLRKLAAAPNVCTKITTIPLGTLAKAGIPFDPLVVACRELFGFDRILWGSDITQSVGSYKDMAGYARTWMEKLSATEAYALAVGNVSRLYRLPVPRPEKVRMGAGGDA